MNRRDFRVEAAQCRSLATSAAEPRKAHLLNLAQHYDLEAESVELRARIIVPPSLRAR